MRPAPARSSRTRQATIHYKRPARGCRQSRSCRRRRAFHSRRRTETRGQPAQGALGCEKDHALRLPPLIMKAAAMRRIEAPFEAFALRGAHRDRLWRHGHAEDAAEGRRRHAQVRIAAARSPVPEAAPCGCVRRRDCSWARSSSVASAAIAACASIADDADFVTDCGLAPHQIAHMAEQATRRRPENVKDAETCLMACGV